MAPIDIKADVDRHGTAYIAVPIDINDAMRDMVVNDEVARTAVGASTQAREKKQKARLRKKIVDDVQASTAALNSRVVAPVTRTPDIFERFKEGQRTNLQRHASDLGIELVESMRFLKHMQSEVVRAAGERRMTNKKLLQLHAQIDARARAASQNCLFKLATASVRMQPAPTPGWSWIVGTVGDDEYHAFKLIGSGNAHDPGSGVYVGVTINYDSGCVGNIDRIFGLTILTLDHAKRSRHEILHWNQRLRLLDALIDKLGAFEPPTSFGAFARTTLSLGVPPVDADPAADVEPTIEVSVSAALRRERDTLEGAMLEACEALARKEQTGLDYTDENHMIAACSLKLPELTKDVNHMLRTARAAQANGQAIRMEFGDGRYCRLGEPEGGWEAADEHARQNEPQGQAPAFPHMSNLDSLICSGPRTKRVDGRQA